MVQDIAAQFIILFYLLIIICLILEIWLKYVLILKKK